MVADTLSDVPPERAPQPLPPALIINAGSVPGLLACWSEGVVRPASLRRGELGTADRPQAPIAWFPPDDRPARARRKQAVERQVELCSMAGFSERAVMRFEPPAHAALHESIARGSRETAMLLSAAVEAASLGLWRVVWPVHAGAGKEVSVDALADTCDRALLAGQLAGLDVVRAGEAGQGGIRIETPYADLSDAQLMDLALDMDVPLGAAWWCMNEDARACGQCAGCMRWREALAAVDPAGRLDMQILATSPADLTPIGPLKQA